MLTRGKYKAATTERHMRPCGRLWSAHATDYESPGGHGGRRSGLRDRREEREHRGAGREHRFGRRKTDATLPHAKKRRPHARLRCC